MRMFVDIYVFVVQMRWIAVRHRRVTWGGDLTWMSMDRYGLGGDLTWMRGMGGIRF